MNDPHLALLEFFPCSKDIFKDVAIADGLSIVLKNMEKKEYGFTYKYSVDGKTITVQANNPGNDMFSLAYSGGYPFSISGDIRSVPS